MRFKVVLLLHQEAFGNVLPVSYQFELSSCIHRKLTDDRDQYYEWLDKNNYEPSTSFKHKLFSLSNLYIPKIKVFEDRLHVLARRVQFWISFLPEVGTEEYVQNALAGQDLLIGDKKSQVYFSIESIEPISNMEFPETVDYLSLSPIVMSCPRSNKSVKYISPVDANYKRTLLSQLIDKYEHFYGEPFKEELVCDFELLSEPKRKGIFIKRFTPNETKIIGYMYKFRLKLNPSLHHLLYYTGLGDKVGLGFGCVEVINNGNR